jgi:hypothetical protein
MVPGWLQMELNPDLQNTRLLKWVNLGDTKDTVGQSVMYM